MDADPPVDAQAEAAMTGLGGGDATTGASTSQAEPSQSYVASRK